MAANRNPSYREYRERRRSCFSKEVVKAQFQDYCRNTSIHGVQYVGDLKRPLFERRWWLFIFLLSCGLNGYLMYRVWAKWRDSPVIVSFRESVTPVWQVPYPAITLCPNVNSRRHQFSMLDSFKIKDPDQDDVEKRAAMSLLCEDVVLINSTSPHLDQSMIDFLIEVAPDNSDTLVGCDIRNMELSCNDMFKPVFTEDGLCFSFNILNHSEIFKENWSVYPYPTDLPEAKYWSLDQGYAKGSPIHVYPHRGFDSGERGGIYLVISGNLSNQDSLCTGPIPGYKIILHNAAEVPFSTEKYIRVPVDQEVLILVTPNIMTTSSNLRSYPPEVRQCFYPDERFLKYFKIYTERNCELECLTNYTLKQCGCASIYMPRDNSTPVCGGSMKSCTINMSYQLRIEELMKSREGVDEDYCNCLPACTSISYSAETSQVLFEWRNASETISNALFNDTETISPDLTYSRMTLFFTDTQFTTTHRSELYGIVDFLANCGGLLGLFSGISFLSFLEILYFLTIRCWSNLRNMPAPHPHHLA